VSTRKPAERRQRGSRTADVGTITPLPTTSPPAPHPTGHRLLDDTVEAWDSFWDSPVSALVNSADMPALRRLFQMYDSRERFEREVRKQPYTTGSTGQVVVNPATKEIASLDSRIDRLEERFGITPKGRLGLGVVLGQAQRSLEEMNRAFDDDTDEEEHDPRRVTAIDAKAREA
jgi:hypothetical protein